jgi:hypothetical protein
MLQVLNYLLSLHKHFNNNIMSKINFDKHIYEGWTVGSFINELEPQFNMIMNGQSWQKKFTTKDEIKKWCMDNQPYYKKYIPDVVNYFFDKLKK